MYTSSSSSSMLTNCNFSGNSSAVNGGGMVNDNSSAILVNCSFSNNSSNYGGGIINSNSFPNGSSSLTLTNCIVWGNTANSDAGIANRDGNNLTITYSIVQASGYNGTNGNWDKDPLFADAPNGDLHLQACSPAVDAGDDNANTTNKDLDDSPRKVGTIDVGAYEYQGTVPPANVWVLDKDNDGYYSGNTVTQCASPGAGYVILTTQQTGDCDDNDASVHAPVQYYVDADHDGYGSTETTMVCSSTAPVGYSTNSDDCNDLNVAVHPGATEICDGTDNNCDGTIDEGCTTLSIADASTNEGNKGKSNMSFIITLSKASAKKVTVQYATQNESATAGNDYVAKSGTLTFKAGTTVQTISISITGDKVVESNETFKVNLSNAVNATIVKATGTGTILNDDLAMARSTTSLQTNDDAIGQSIKISPNPASSMLHVDLSGYTGSVTMQLINLEGKVMKKEKIEIGIQKYIQQQINVTNILSGAYFLVVIDEKGNRQTENVIILR